MTTPKDTWISLKDAMPPIQIPADCDLIVMDEIGCIFSIELVGGWVNDRSFMPKRYVNQLTGKEPKYTDWMLLSKPKTK